MRRIIVTGFEPFDNRPVNASWIAARQMQEMRGEQSLVVSEIPVVWGEPENALDALLADEEKPAAIIAMGEGKPGSFRLETLALNRRAVKPDNNAQLPPHEQVNPLAPDSLRTSAPLHKIRQGLLARDLPVLLSVDAGSYLCEETLFHLEHRFKDYTHNQLALFVHLPPYGTTLQFKGRQRSCEETLLLEFGNDLLDVISSHLDTW